MIIFFLDLEPLRGQVPVDHPAKIEIAGLEALPSLSLSLSLFLTNSQPEFEFANKLLLEFQLPN